MYSTVCLVILSLFFSPSLCAECRSHQPLGMENGMILDSQITASSEYDANHGAANGRLNFQPSGDRTGAWSVKYNDVNQWLQVDLLGQAEISEIQIQGRGCCDQFVKSYTISYSTNGATFTDYRQSLSAQIIVFTGNSDISSVVSNVLSPAIKARYIRVSPQSWNEFISMRIELVGCRKGGGGNMLAVYLYSKAFPGEQLEIYVESLMEASDNSRRYSDLSITTTPTFTQSCKNRVKGHKQQSSAIAKHCKNVHGTIPQYLPKCFEVLKKCRNKFDCLFELDSNSCAVMKERGYCTNPFFTAQCPKVCSSVCSNYMPDAGCSFIKQNGDCKDLFPFSRKTCTKCDVLYASLGCFISKNADRIMNTLLHIDFADPDIVNVCAQKAAARGYSVFGVEAGGECSSDPNAELTFRKHGQANHGDCIDGKGNSHRVSVYKFV